MPPPAAVGLIGLGVMGSNLALNIERNGFPVAVHDRSYERTSGFLEGPAAGKDFVGAHTPAELVAALERPRRIVVLVPAGPAVDQVLDGLVPLLDAGDVVVDSGNSHFVDTDRRLEALAGSGVQFLGTGVSGGESGALWGPSIMPGGSEDAYRSFEPVFAKIAAQVEDGACVTYVGPGSAGHYVKMVHNGIEYGNMQLVAEAYAVLAAAGLSSRELADVFGEWNRGELESFLIAITADIFNVRDADSGDPLVDRILDAAGQKGTGRWTTQDAMELGEPVPTIDAAAWTRNISARIDQRIAASKLIGASGHPTIERRADLVEDVRQALYASMLCSYAQGFSLLRTASAERDYQVNFAEVARIWKGGCIIRARLLRIIQHAFSAAPALANLLMDAGFAAPLAEAEASWRAVLADARRAGIPVPATSASLDYFDSYRTARLPANLIQAQRDYFGAHTYRRTDRDGVFHTNWEAGAESGSAASEPAG